MMRGLVFVLVLLAAINARPASAAPTFAEVFEGHGAVMLLIDPDSGAIVDANPAAARFYGYPRERLRAMTVQDINALTPEQVAEERKLAALEQRNYFIFRHRLGDGDIRTVEVHSHPFDFDGHKLLLSLIRDISDQRAAEDALWRYQTRLERMVDDQLADLQARDRLIIAILTVAGVVQLALIAVLVASIRRRRRAEAALRRREATLNAAQRIAKLGSWELDLVTDRLVWSDEIYRIFEIDRDRFEVSFASFLAAVHPDDRAAVKQAYENSLTDRTPYRIVHRLLMADGRVKWVVEHCETQYGRDGAPLRSAGTIQDVTEAKTAEVEREHLVRDLTRVNSELQAIANVAAHHLQEPSRRLVTYAQKLRRLMDDEAAEPAVVEALGFLEADALRSLRLVGDMELYLAAAAPRGPLLPCDAGKAAEDARNVLASAIGAASATVEVAEMPWAVMDEARLRDLFTILIDNALVHGAGVGGLVVRISGERDGALVRYRVEDNGPGIPADYRARVLRLFEKLDARSNGTGIGLAIVRRMAESRGGRIWIEEGASGGAAVVFDLPAAPLG